ncbi:MAG TPA: hypothetical protein VN924_05310 [Bryobacteraceae bacterium]|nr:hypothetical protein [Bryobacteraceae bacterium]
MALEVAVIIRREQMEAFDAASRKAFEDSTYRHLQEYFPQHCELLGEDQMRRVIRHGWKKAEIHDLTDARCVRSYIEFMCQLGSGFDSDILLPWAAETLNDRSAIQITRADRLYHRVWDYVDHIARDYRDAEGIPTTQRFVPQLRQVRRDSSEHLDQANAARFCETLGQRLTRSLPEKCAYVGAENLRRAITEAVESARTYGITVIRGATLFAVMRFVLGAEFDRDPLIPWASSVLLDKTITDQFKRVDKLYAAGVSFLGRWWDLSFKTGEPRNVLE